MNTKLCLQITNEMIIHPCCSLFLDAVDPIKDGVPHYYKIIKNPQDLTSIKKRLINNEYKNIKDWKKDMDLIWYNCIKFNGRDTIIGELAQSTSKIFEKKCKKLLPKEINEWLIYLSELNKKLNDILINSPLTLNYKFKDNLFKRKYLIEDIKNLSTAISSLNTKSDILQMVQLLKLFGINVDGKRENPQISLLNLPDTAISIIMTYVKERFKALHIEYPK